MKKRILLPVILCGFLFCLSSVAVQAAGDFLGDICWSIDDGSGDTFPCKLGVFSIGSGHYLLSGTVQYSADEIYITHGNAEIIRNKIHMSIVFADGNNNAMSSTHALCVLDPSTLNGTYNAVKTGAVDTGETGIKYLSGTLTLIPCQ